MKVKNKLLGVLGGVVMLCLLGVLVPSVSRAETLFDNAIMWEPYKLVTPQEGQMYKFTFNTKQTVTFWSECNWNINSGGCGVTFYDDNGLSLDETGLVATWCGSLTTKTFDAGTYYMRVNSNRFNITFWYTLSNPVSSLLDDISGTPFEGASSLQAMELYSQDDYTCIYKKIELTETKKFTLKSDKAEYAVLLDSHALEVKNESNLEPGTYFLRMYGTITNLYYVLTNPDQATAVSLSKQSATLSVGQTLKLTYSLTPANCIDTVTWGSGDTNVATVDENGNVKAVGEGQCLIIATSSSKKSAACTITVKKATSSSAKKTSGSSTKTVSSSSKKVGKVTSVKARAKKTGKKKKVTISWKKVSGATGYQVYYSSSSNGKFKKLGTVTNKTKLTKTFKNKKTHYFKVRAYSTSSGKKTYGSFSKAVKK